eukprot:tig00000388_g24822.t1
MPTAFCGPAVALRHAAACTLPWSSDVASRHEERSAHVAATVHQLRRAFLGSYTTAFHGACVPRLTVPFGHARLHPPSRPWSVALHEDATASSSASDASKPALVFNPDAAGETSFDNFSSVDESDPEAFNLRDQNALPIVESAFLASLSWLAFVTAPLLGAPPLKFIMNSAAGLPIAIAMLRWNAAQGFKTFAVASFLVATASQQSVLGVFNFFFGAGILAGFFGTAWKYRMPWVLSIPLGTVVKTVGLLGQIKVFSVVLGSDIFSRIVAAFTKLLNNVVSPKLFKGAFQFTVTQVTLAVLAVFVANALAQVVCLHIAGQYVIDRLPRNVVSVPPWLLAKGSKDGMVESRGATA